MTDNTVKQTASVMDMTFSNFDFNLNYMKFIAGLFTNAHSVQVAKLADDMRIWGMTRSANPKISALYQARLTLDGEKVVNGSEFISLTTDEMPTDDFSNLSVMLSTFLPGDWETVSSPVAPLQALELYDRALQALKPQLSDTNLGAYASLRHQIASAARMASSAQVRDESITFEIQGDGMVYIFKAVIPHIAPNKFAAMQAA